jgi:hypothetical protein
LKERKRAFVYLDGHYVPPIGWVFDKLKPEGLRAAARTGHLWKRASSACFIFLDYGPTAVEAGMIANSRDGRLLRDPLLSPAFISAACTKA